MKKQITKINRNNWVKLKELDGSTIDKKLNILMDRVGQDMPFVDYSTEMKSINVYEDTLKRLDGFHITHNESRDNIITRLLLMADSPDLTKFVPFKITNPYNNLLVLEGQLEINSKEISFNYRGNIFMGKLPPSYVVEGKDLTKELYLWYDNLNWSDIIDKIVFCTSSEEDLPFKNTYPNYVLEINSY